MYVRPGGRRNRLMMPLVWVLPKSLVDCIDTVAGVYFHAVHNAKEIAACCCPHLSRHLGRLEGCESLPSTATSRLLLLPSQHSTLLERPLRADASLVRNRDFSSDIVSAEPHRTSPSETGTPCITRRCLPNHHCWRGPKGVRHSDCKLFFLD